MCFLMHAYHQSLKPVPEDATEVPPSLTLASPTYQTSTAYDLESEWSNVQNRIQHTMNLHRELML